MAAAVHRRVLPRSPASMESLTRGIEVLDLCKTGNVEKFRKLLDINSALIHQKDEQGNGLSYYAVESRSVDMCEFVYEKREELFSSSTPAGRAAFRRALCLKEDKIINWFLQKDGMHFFERDENGDSSISWACKQNLEEVVDLILTKEPDMALDKDTATSSNPFLIACSLGSLQLAQRIYRECAYIINFRDKFEETALLKAFKAPEGHAVVEWLLSDVKACIVCEEEAVYFIKIILNLRRDIVKRVLRESAPFFFILHLKEIKVHVKDSKILAPLKTIATALPVGFSYRGHGTAHLTGRPLIEYYNVVIDDISAIEDPCNRLMMMFSQLTVGDYVTNMNLGRQGELATPSEAANKRERELALCHQFIIDAIHQEKPDKSIPRGEEGFYYIHLKRIFKHLVKYLEELEESKRKDEKFSYLSMITSVSGTCYTNYSTLCHNMYGALVGDASLVEAASQEDLPSVQFFNQMTAFYKRKIKGKALIFLQERDAHEVSVIQKFFDQRNIPYFGEVAPFDNVNALPALLAIRRNILGIEDSQDNLDFYTDEELYDGTRDGVIQKFNEEVNSIKFIYAALKEFLLFKLNGEGSAQFLEMLNEWLTENGISADTVLEYDEERNSYKILVSGLYEMLKRFPREITI